MSGSMELTSAVDSHARAPRVGRRTAVAETGMADCSLPACRMGQTTAQRQQHSDGEGWNTHADDEQR